MKIFLTKYFWISLIVLVVLFIAPYIASYDAPFVDGSRVIGFPLTVYSYGGWCVATKSCAGFMPKRSLLMF